MSIPVSMPLSSAGYSFAGGGVGGTEGETLSLSFPSSTGGAPGGGGGGGGVDFWRLDGELLLSSASPLPWSWP